LSVHKYHLFVWKEHTHMMHVLYVKVLRKTFPNTLDSSIVTYVFQFRNTRQKFTIISFIPIKHGCNMIWVWIYNQDWNNRLWFWVTYIQNKVTIVGSTQQWSQNRSGFNLRAGGSILRVVRPNITGVIIIFS